MPAWPAVPLEAALHHAVALIDEAKAARTLIEQTVKPSPRGQEPGA